MVCFCIMLGCMLSREKSSLPFFSWINSVLVVWCRWRRPLGYPYLFAPGAQIKWWKGSQVNRQPEELITFFLLLPLPHSHLSWQLPSFVQFNSNYNLSLVLGDKLDSHIAQPSDWSQVKSALVMLYYHLLLSYTKFIFGSGGSHSSMYSF